MDAVENDANDVLGQGIRHRLPETAGQLSQGNSVWTASGPAVFTTMLVIEALAYDPSGVLYTISRQTSFVIDWGPEYSLQFPDRPLEDPLVLGNGAMQPVQIPFQTVYAITFAEHTPVRIDVAIPGADASTDLAANTIGNLPADSALVGPNTGFKFLANPVTLYRPHVATSPAIYGVGQWAQDQNGVEEGTGLTQKNGTPFCGQSIFPGLRDFTLRHEGVTAGGPSHFDIYQQSFTTRHLGEVLKRTFFPNGESKLAMRTRINGVIASQLAPDEALQQNLDATDYDALEPFLGCDLDGNPVD